MTRNIENTAPASLQRASETEGIITDAQLAGLPDPIQRYLRYARVIGKRPISAVHLAQRGAMRMKDGAAWLPMIATQQFTTQPPAFVWSGTLRLFAVLPVTATDTFADGRGTLAVKALSRIPVQTARGPEMDQGELLRYLGEMAWFPTALLSECIRWEPINAGSAKATISLSGVTAFGVFHVDAHGQYTHFTADRVREAGKRRVGAPTPWIGRWDRYEERNGFRVPMRAEAAWSLQTGEFSYFRGEITAIAYNAPPTSSFSPPYSTIPGSRRGR